MSGEVDPIAQAADYRSKHVTELAQVHIARIQAEIHADLVEGKLTHEEWESMPLEERMSRYFYKGVQ